MIGAMDEVAPPRDPAGIRWDAVAVVAALVALVAGVVQHGGERDAVDPAHDERIVWPDHAAFGAPLVAERKAGAPSGRGSASGEMQLCGGEWIAADADQKALDEAMDRAHRETERITLDRMLSSGDARAIAAALQLRALAERTPSGDPSNGAEVPSSAALVDMALTGADPEVYASAMAACAHDPRAGRCPLLNAAQWARLDTENAFAWLARAGEAHAEGDRAGEDDALWRVARATRFDSGNGSAIGHVLAHAPDDDEHAVGTTLLAVKALAAHPSTADWFKSCATASLADPTRRERCHDVATTLVARADTLVHRRIGKSIGQRLGWSAERLREIDDEEKALMQAQPFPETVAGYPFQCPTTRRGLDWLRQVAAFGETGALARAATTRTAASGR